MPNTSNSTAPCPPEPIELCGSAAIDSLSIVVPAYNEESRLPDTLEALLAYLDQRSFSFREVLVVDDGSTDRTAEVAARVARAHPHVRLLRNAVNRGKGFSVRRGILQAAGEWVLFTDADLSAPIEELDRLIEAARLRDATVVFGSRALDRSLISVEQSAFRQAAGRCFNLLVRLATGLRFKDTQCGFKLFHARAGREICRRQRIERWGFDVEQLFLARKLGFAAAEVPVRWAHCEGTKIRMLYDSLNMFVDLLRIRLYEFRRLYR